jgi:hypothetical protein
VPPVLPRQPCQKVIHHPYKITLTCNWVLISIKRFTTHFSTHNKGYQVQLKLKRFYYMGMLHPTAKTGAIGFGPPSLPDRDSWDTDTLKLVPLWSRNRFHRVLTDRADRTQMTKLWIDTSPPFVINRQ